MIFRETPLPGAFAIELEPRRDDRGFFARSFCQQEFGEAGLVTTWVQNNVAWNPRRHTLRGMHFQLPPYAEVKLVRCTGGAIYDVIVDLRPDSPTRFEWLGLELTAANRAMLYVPEGFGHGYVTLEDDTEVFYQVSQFYHPEAARGVRWDDPFLAIEWPEQPEVLSEADRSWPLIDLANVRP